MQYKIIDVIDPLSALHENNSIMFESLADETLNLYIETFARVSQDVERRF